ncbi:hypothetical protein Y1Q_0013605 [Alligator mississippiensis]|uniref:Uncharacterized protein n=1 Tax=Alligator mississippiensis TaxID=8496 RepID=A0A151P3D9_ALLMI|nr:hypothetical protein Y1Q_0013605 [Alligator mississippiensis]
MTLKTIDDDAWNSQLSLGLQQQTGSYACSSLEKVHALGNGWVSAAVSWCCGRKEAESFSPEFVPSHSIFLIKGIFGSLLYSLAQRELLRGDLSLPLAAISLQRVGPAPEISEDHRLHGSLREQVLTILAFSAKGHLDLTLGTLEDFGAAMSKVQASLWSMLPQGVPNG